MWGKILRNDGVRLILSILTKIFRQLEILTEIVIIMLYRILTNDNGII